jgi:molecular chaperone DnaK (HSP70)
MAEKAKSYRPPKTSRLSASTAPTRRKIYVGIDLGTTFTGKDNCLLLCSHDLICTFFLGVSYVSSIDASAKDVEVIRTWPGPSKPTCEVWKTPTIIAYKSENQHLKAMTQSKNTTQTSNDTMYWGYQVTPAMNSYAWFKLRLDDSSKMTDFDDLTVGKMSNSQGKGLLELPRGKSVEDVCADFLSCVHDHFMARLTKTYGSAMLTATPMEFWLTVPAIWSDKAKAVTRSAARRAGFCSRAGDEMFLISEPEAAAAASISKMTGSGVDNQLKVGDGGKYSISVLSPCCVELIFVSAYL